VEVRNLHGGAAAGPRPRGKLFREVHPAAFRGDGKRPAAEESALRKPEVRLPEKSAGLQVSVRSTAGENSLQRNHFADLEAIGAGCRTQLHLQIGGLL